MRQKLATARRLGFRDAVRHLASVAARALWIRERLVVFAMRPEQLNPVRPELGREDWQLRSEALSAFHWAGAIPVPASLAGELRSATPGQRVHWVQVGSEIVSWGFSAPAPGSWPLTETRSRLRVPLGGVCLFAFETVPAFRGRRLYPAVLTGILDERFREGATLAYIWCRQDNVASYRAIRRVGFREVAVHEFERFLGVSRRRESSLP
jgi:RimJ/RimL family protein N-acetyltransferase